MPTQPRRWPIEVEVERDGALRAANEAILLLQKAQETLDIARDKLQSSQAQAMVLIADSDRFVADATTRMERIKRFITVAKSKQLSGRWPMVATKQRDDVEDATNTTIFLLEQAEEFLSQARNKLLANAGMGEAIIADVANFQAKALTYTERISRLLTEASIGRI